MIDSMQSQQCVRGRLRRPRTTTPVSRRRNPDEPIEHTDADLSNDRSAPTAKLPPLGSLATSVAAAEELRNGPTSEVLHGDEIRSMTDAELIAAVRKDNITMYGELYARHVGAAHNLAQQFARSAIEEDDLVSEAFSKVLSTVRAGGGPNSAFRAYMLKALRHIACDVARKARKVALTDDIETMVDSALVNVNYDETVVAGFENGAAARAFRRIPERWQEVLWLTEVHCKTPAEVAVALGMTPNSVSALAYRAREGLRQAYLQAHLSDDVAPGCWATVEKLGSWVRNGLSKRKDGQVREHLAKCGSCRDSVVELIEINTSFRFRATEAPTERSENKVRRQVTRCRTPLAMIGGARSVDKLAS